MTEVVDEPVKDYVCGMIKPKSQMKSQTIYKGKVFYFCSEDDKKMFEAIRMLGYPARKKLQCKSWGTNTHI